MFQLAHADEGEVHQGDRAVRAAKVGADFLIGLPSPLDGRGALGIEGDVGNLGEKRGVAAVVGPVGVQHFDLGDAGVAVFFVAEVGLTERDILGGHGEGEFGAEGGGVLAGEAGEDGDVSGGVWGVAVANRRHGDFVGIHGIDDEGLDSRQLVRTQHAAENDDLGRDDERAVLAGENLDALGGGVGALVELAGKVFHGEGGLGCGQREVRGGAVHLGFGEDEAGGGGEFVRSKPVDVVALDDADGAEPGKSEGFPEFVTELAGFGAESGLFFDKNSVHGEAWRCEVRHRRRSARERKPNAETRSETYLDLLKCGCAGSVRMPVVRIAAGCRNHSAEAPRTPCRPQRGSPGRGRAGGV